MRQLERNVLLNVLDRKWREHLYEMDYLKEGIGLRAMAQRDPLVEYQREGWHMFMAMLEGLKEESVGFLFNVQVQAAPQTAPVAPAATPEGLAKLGGGPRRKAPRSRGCTPRASTTTRPLTYSGPAEDGSTEVRRNGGQQSAGLPRHVRNAANRRARKPRTRRRCAEVSQAALQAGHQPRCSATSCHRTPVRVFTSSARQATARTRPARV